MAIGKRNTPKQQTLWVATSDLAPRSGHPFYSKLNSILDEDTFDAWLEQECVWERSGGEKGTGRRGRP